MKQKQFIQLIIGLLLLVGILQAQQYEQRQMKPQNQLQLQESAIDDHHHKENFIIGLQGYYSVGSQCLSGCPQTFYYTPMNSFKCPKSNGSIHWESLQDQFYLNFSTISGENFFAPFGTDNVIINKYGNYEIVIELEAGYGMRIVPCNVQAWRGDDDLCQYKYRDRQLIVIKEVPEEQLYYINCSFTLTKNK